jgi:hypothetical protein
LNMRAGGLCWLYFSTAFAGSTSFGSQAKLLRCF